MLNKDRKQRLGQNNDVNDILLHPWFKDLDIDKLLKKKLAAPYVPTVEGKTDLRNFDPEVVGQELAESIIPPESIKIITQKDDAFSGFGPSSVKMDKIKDKKSDWKSKSKSSLAAMVPQDIHYLYFKDYSHSIHFSDHFLKFMRLFPLQDVRCYCNIIVMHS